MLQLCLWHFNLLKANDSIPQVALSGSTFLDRFLTAKWTGGCVEAPSMSYKHLRCPISYVCLTCLRAPFTVDPCDLEWVEPCISSISHSLHLNIESSLAKFRMPVIHDWMDDSVCIGKPCLTLNLVTKQMLLTWKNLFALIKLVCALKVVLTTFPQEQIWEG